MTCVLKRKDFARWQAAEKLPDIALCKVLVLDESLAATAADLF